jgi:hypothetical protein
MVLLLAPAGSLLASIEDIGSIEDIASVEISATDGKDPMLPSGPRFTSKLWLAKTEPPYTTPPIAANLTAIVRSFKLLIDPWFIRLI